MKKIPTLFKRDFTQKGNPITREYADDTEWVQQGDGIATKKYDGTCCMIRDDVLYKRYELKPGKTPPVNFEAVDTDEETGKTVGWVPVGDGPEDQYHREAFEYCVSRIDRTYELVGPKIQGNPEGYAFHYFIAHEAAEQYPDAPRTYDDLREWLADKDIEGLVWHHPDGRMVKIKKKDFGLPRKPGTIV